MRRNRISTKDRIFVALPALLLGGFFSWLTSIIFITDLKLRFICTCLGLIMPGKAIERLIQAGRDKIKWEESEQFLGYLSGQISSGYTLERALLDAPSALKEQMGRRGKLVKLLNILRRQLLAQTDLSSALLQLDHSFACSRLSQDLAILPWLSQYGGQMDVYLRESHRQIYMETALRAEVEAENSQKTTEALVMSFLPLIFGALLFKQHINPQSIATTSGWIKLSGFVFQIVTLVTISLTLMIMSKPQLRNTKSIEVKPKNKNQVPRKFYKKSASIYLKLLPASFGYRLNRIVRQSESEQTTDHLWQQYLQKKFLYLLCGLLIGFILLVSGEAPWWVVVLAIFIFPVLQDLGAFNSAKKQKQAYRLIYPPFLSMLSLLMESGLTLQIALDLSIKATKNIIGSGQVSSDLEHARNSLESGITASQAVRGLANRCPLPEISAALRCAARYDQQGSAELLTLMSMQTVAGWHIYRNGLRRQLEQRSLLLFLPMGMALLNVLAIAVVPALASFQII